MTNPTPVENLWGYPVTRMSVFDSEKSRACNPSLREACVDFGEESCLFGEAERAYESIPCFEAVTVKPSCD